LSKKSKSPVQSFDHNDKSLPTSTFKLESIQIDPALKIGQAKKMGFFSYCWTRVERKVKTTFYKLIEDKRWQQIILSDATQATQARQASSAGRQRANPILSC